MVCGSLRNRGKPMAAQLAVAPDRPPVAGDQEPNANNVDDDQMDDNSQVSSSDEDWEHSVATSAIDPSDESSEAHNEDVDDEVYFIRYCDHWKIYLIYLTLCRYTGRLLQDAAGSIQICIYL